MNWLARSLVVATLLAAAPAFADDAPVDDGGGFGFRGQGSLLAGRTLGNGADAIHAHFGWPGVGIDYLHGAGPNLDFGGSFNFVYGFEDTTHTAPGMKLAGIIRLELLDNGKVNLGLRFDPGISMYFGQHYVPRGDFAFGLATPIQLALGVSAGEAIMIDFAIDMPMTVFFTPEVVFSLPILTGVGLEYHVDSHLSVTLNSGFGPDILMANGGSATEFAFKLQAGIGYRF